MGSASAVGVDDDFAPCKAGVAVRSPDYEFAGWVDVQDDVFVEKPVQFLREHFHKAGKEHFGHIFADDFEHLHVGFILCFPLGRSNEIVVLG